jgi:hypothetical protein
MMSFMRKQMTRRRRRCGRRQVCGADLGELGSLGLGNRVNRIDAFGADRVRFSRVDDLPARPFDSVDVEGLDFVAAVRKYGEPGGHFQRRGPEASQGQR